MIITSIKKKIRSHRVGEEVDNIELTARAYQEPQNNKKKQIRSSQKPYLNRHVTKEDIQMAMRHLRWYPISVIREMQNLNYNVIPLHSHQNGYN